MFFMKEDATSKIQQAGDAVRHISGSAQCQFDDFLCG
jgi:hypothetical protein